MKQAKYIISIQLRNKSLNFCHEVNTNHYSLCLDTVGYATINMISYKATFIMANVCYGDWITYGKKLIGSWKLENKTKNFIKKIKLSTLCTTAFEIQQIYLVATSFVLHSKFLPYQILHCFHMYQSNLPTVCITHIHTVNWSHIYCYSFYFWPPKNNLILSFSPWK